MPISYEQFRPLPLVQQLLLVWKQGTFLAARWEQENAGNLYHLDDDFLSAVYCDKDNDILHVQCFISGGPLEKYTSSIYLSTLFK